MSRGEIKKVSSSGYRCNPMKTDGKKGRQRTGEKDEKWDKEIKQVIQNNRGTAEETQEQRDRWIV